MTPFLVLVQAGVSVQFFFADFINVEFFRSSDGWSCSILQDDCTGVNFFPVNFHDSE